MENDFSEPNNKKIVYFPVSNPYQKFLDMEEELDRQEIAEYWEKTHQILNRGTTIKNFCIVIGMMLGLAAGFIYMISR